MTPNNEDFGWPTALKNDTRIPHPIYNFLSYHWISPCYFSFISVVF